MATHSSVLAWRIPGMGEPGGLPSMGSHRVGHDWSDLAAAAAATSSLVSFLLHLIMKGVWPWGKEGCAGSRSVLQLSEQTVVLSHFLVSSFLDFFPFFFLLFPPQAAFRNFKVFSLCLKTRLPAKSILFNKVTNNCGVNKKKKKYIDV